MQVTLNLKSVSLESAFAEIKKQSGYGFWYEKKDLEGLSKVSLELKNANIVTALEICLKGQPLSYQVFDKTVVVKRIATAPASLPVKKLSQEKIKGKVVDVQTKEPLAGVLIKVKVPAITVVSNDKGVFELALPVGRYELALQLLGYQLQEISVDVPTKDELLISLVSTENVLEEVKINAGYYSVKQRELTGSITKVSAQTIQRQPISNPLQALQGRVAGLEVTQLTGVPGGGFKIQVRGRNSISSGGDPLYIIDGIIFPSSRINTANSNTITQDASPLGMVNPNDIESIEVLKDADATAIYGSRGANGVILITTKRAKSDALSVNLNLQQGFSQVGNFVSMMNTEQYLAMRMEAFANDGLAPSANDYDVNGIWDKNKNTDWQKVLIGGKAAVRNVSASISGGNKTATFLLGANHSHEETVFEGDFGLTRNGINFNLNLGNTSDRLNAVFSGGYNTATSKLMSTDPTINIAMAPNAPDVFDESGGLLWKYNGTDVLFNPMASLNHTIDATTNNLLANVVLNYRILEGLNFKTSFGYNVMNREEFSRRPNSARVPATNPTSANRESQFGNNKFSSWILEPQVNYNLALGRAKLSAILGTSFQEANKQYRNILASNFNSDDLMENISSASVFAVRESTYASYRYAAIFGRLNFTLSDKYFLNVTARRDGSSRFGLGNQFANFWAVGAAWIFSEEKPLRELEPVLSFGKLRASYGLTGNDQIPDYGYMQLYNNSGSYQGISTLNIGRIANPNYAWETNWKAELAMELGLFKDLLNLQFAYFRNRSSNQLAGLSLPPSVGSSSIQANLPATVQNTGLEIEGRVKLIEKKLWRWQASFNLTFPKNKLVSYPGLSSSTNATSYIVGRPLGITRYYDTFVDPQTGVYVFRDYNNNGLRDDADRYLNTFLGQQYYGGLQNSLSYGKFNLDVHVSFVKQTGRSLLSGVGLPMGYFIPADPTGNVPSVFSGSWKRVGDQSNVRKYTTLVGGLSNLNLGKSMGAQSIDDASFIRLRNVALSYDLPGKLLKWGKMKNVQLTLQGQNLFTITGYKGLDPENQFLNRLPPLRTILFGARANF